MAIKTNRFGTIYDEVDGEVLSKTCSTCKKMLPIDNYTKQSRGVGKTKPNCRQCCSAYAKTYYTENMDELLSYKKKWEDENKGKIKERLERTREKRLKRQREHYQGNRKVKISKTRAWQIANQPRVRANYNRRRARQMSLPTDKDLSAVYEYNEGRCVFTDVSENVHMDHFIPLSIGHGGTVVGNLILLRGDLNISKNNSNPFEWFRENKERFSLCDEKFASVIQRLADINEMTTEDYKDYVYWCFDNPRETKEIIEGGKDVG